MPTVKLNESQVRVIKRRIWFGATREILSGEFGVTIGQICNIGAGFKWKDIPWPDGSFGGLPDKRARMIEQARREVHVEIEPLIEKRLRSMTKAGKRAA